MSRRAALAAAFLSLAGVLVAGYEMSRRVSAFNATRVRFVFQAVAVREFTYAGLPATVRDEPDAEGRKHVVVRFADQERRIPVPAAASVDERETSLARHSDWLRVLRFIPLTGSRPGDLDRLVDAGEIKDRLALIARRGVRETGDPLADLDTLRNRPVFLILEFQEDGTLAESNRWFNIADEPLGLPEDELRPGTWEYDAALSVRPMRGKPKPRFSDNAVGAMGWTLPVGFLSILALALSMAFALVRVPRRESATGTPT